MIQDPAILGFLGRALSFEFSAVQQYLSLSKLLEMRGMSEAGKRFRHEAEEEMEHAERIIARMLALGFAPNASQLRPVRADGSLVDLMRHAAELEHEIVALYSQAVNYCVRANDPENKLFFGTLLQEEQKHAGEIDAWRRELNIGQ